MGSSKKFASMPYQRYIETAAVLRRSCHCCSCHYIVVVMFVLPKFVLLFRRSRFSENARTRKFRMSTRALCLVVIPMRPVGGNPTLLARSNFSYLLPNVRRTDGRTDRRTDKRDAAGQIFRLNMPLLESLDGNGPTVGWSHMVATASPHWFH